MTLFSGLEVTVVKSEDRGARRGSVGDIVVVGVAICIGNPKSIGCQHTDC